MFHGHRVRKTPQRTRILRRSYRGLNQHPKTCDLPKAFAIASFYNMLFSPKKTKLLADNCRILGHEISREAMSLSQEKIDKLEKLQPPTDAKDLKSKLAFFSYFNQIAPRLSELLGPLRELAKTNKRFKLTDEHMQAFEDAKNHLLADETNAIRMPSADLDHTPVLFVDASSSSISCVLTQLMPPIGQPDGERKLYLVGCFSKVIPEGWRNYPTWLLELTSLSEATHKFKYLLQGRSFWVVTDSSVVQN